jgi:hypothetical protein
MKEKFKVLQEDDQKIYNKWVKGIAKYDGPSQVITVDDIINRYRNNVSYDAPRQLPFGINFLLDRVGDMFVKCADMRMDLSNAMKNPVISEHTQRVSAVKSLNDKINKIQELLFSCTEEMNKIVETKEN